MCRSQTGHGETIIKESFEYIAFFLLPESSGRFQVKIAWAGPL